MANPPHKLKHVIFAVRRSFKTAFGGDNVQILKTREALRRLFDIDVIICDDPHDIASYPAVSLVHYFNINLPEAREFALHSRKNGKRFVISPIYWDLTHSVFVSFLAKMRLYRPTMASNTAARLLQPIMSALFQLLTPFAPQKTYYYPYSRWFIGQRRKTLEAADLILPNSPEEADLLLTTLQACTPEMRSKIHVVPNAVDLSWRSTAMSDMPQKRRSGVIQVGRLEPLKNQLNILHALYYDKDIPITFIGAPGNDAYAQQVRKVAQNRGNVTCIERLPHHEIRDHLLAHRVHALPSFRESPGLASLEALACGCQILVSRADYCPIRYYEFDKFGFVCNPYDPGSIRKGLLDALHTPRQAPREEYFQRFSYDTVAKMTFAAYGYLFGHSKASTK